MKTNAMNLITWILVSIILSFSKISSLKITYVALSLLKPPPLFDGLGAHLIAPIPYFSFVV